MLRHPFALGTRFHQHGAPEGDRQCGREPLATVHDPALADGAGLGEDAQLTLALLDIDSYHIDGGWPPGVCPAARR